MGQLPAIAVLGGSGELGSALARRWAQAGYPVIIGSRSADRAIEVSAQIGQQVRGAENVEAAKAAEVIVVAVPYSNHAQILEAIKPTASGKIVVDVVLMEARPRSKRRRYWGRTSRLYLPFITWGLPRCTQAARSIVTYLCLATTRRRETW